MLLARFPSFHRVLRRAAIAAVCAAAFGGPAGAHDYRAGGVRIGHPFATPSPAGAMSGAAYVATLENGGAAADRLLRASSPAAERVEIHTMSLDAGVMRMREVDAIDLPPAATVRMRPGAGYHFMLMGLKQPLKEGDTFPMTLDFERGGKVEVKVVVQVPRGSSAAAAEHKH